MHALRKAFHFSVVAQIVVRTWFKLRLAGCLRKIIIPNYIPKVIFLEVKFYLLLCLWTLLGTHAIFPDQLKFESYTASVNIQVYRV